MGAYQSLPIYKVVYETLMKIMQISHQLPREYKYTLGEKMQNEGIELVLSIYRANTAKNRVEQINIMKEHIQLLYLLLRMCHDLKLISMDKYAEIVEMVDNISQQAHGWLKASEKMRESS